MTEETRRQFHDLACKGATCKTKDEAEAVWQEKEDYIKKNKCDELETSIIMMETGSSERLFELSNGTEFKAVPTKPKY